MPDTAFGTILVCLDASPIDELSLRYATAIAQANHANLLLLKVVDPGRSTRPRPVDTLGIEIAKGGASQYLQQLADRLAGDGIMARIQTAQGRAAEQILQVAEREDVSLIVFAADGGHGDGRRFRLNSTAHHVIQHARRSFVLIRPNAELGPPDVSIGRVLVPLDGSAAAESALARAADLARSTGGEVVIAHAVVHPELPTCEPPNHADSQLLRLLERRNHELARSYVRSVCRGLQGASIACRTVFTACDSADRGILKLAEDERADLIVMASHGHTSSEDVVHGAVTHQLLAYAKTPVWVVQNVHAGPQRATGVCVQEERAFDQQTNRIDVVDHVGP